MGYATKRVKRRRHNDHLRLYAATVLAGVQYQQWAQYRRKDGGQYYHTQPVYEAVLPEPIDTRLWPCGPLASAVRKAAKIMGIK